MIWNSISYQPWIVVAVLFGLAEACLQLILLAALPFRPIGDETEYIERGRSKHPFSADPFFRVPFLPAMAWLGGRTGRTSVFLRLTSISFSVGAVAATAGAATLLGGTSIATVLCLGLLLIPERIVLGSRIWPDVYLAATTSCIALVLSMTPAVISLDLAAVLTGALISAAVMIRLDALVLIPAITGAWVLVSPTNSAIQACWLMGLPLAVFGVWWLISRVVFNERWPDTTWLFNLGIAAQESLVQPKTAAFAVDDLIERHQTAKVNLGGEENPGADRARSPVPFDGYARSAGSRLRAMIGPDTFVQGKILANTEWRDHSVARPILAILFRISTPFLVAVTLGLFAWHPTVIGWVAIPGLSLMIPAVLFHARTRYRLPLLYGLVPVLAGTISHLIARPQPAGVVIAIVVSLLALGLFLSRKPRRLERP